MSNAAHAVDGLPLIGNKLQAPFTQAQDAGASMDHAGQHLGAAVTTLAQVMGSVTACLPIGLGLLAWAVVRLPYVRRAGRARALSDTAAGMDVLALAALTTAGPRELGRIGPEPANGWRERDPLVIAALATLQLDRLGICCATPPQPVPPTGR
ncbi:hypothetical protein [Allobranchiibius sp. CTAmp26]|uniref:hypothetical protein n=1 Tax=Allobranchiibius sp. CTAmp26 TaxID=2815214 RepID=UPI001AA0B988|nr:hypothetical protein [Allobranchiibius sp. CTAmp26]MBO1756492.1 hypothetical protein [Allobranchiibius sp. CTAmp26]